jgi:hypothetical protein
MKDTPILFSGPMVNAILDGRKTQTRRIFDVGKLKPSTWSHSGIEALRYDVETGLWQAKTNNYNVWSRPFKCPYGTIGSTLWVRETFYVDLLPWANGGKLPDEPTPEILESLYYRADGTCCEQIPECQCHETGKTKWRPSIFLKRKYNRINLEITGVRVERLNDISADDARAEGHPVRPEVSDDPEVHDDAARDWFMDLWDVINGKRASWASNPFVWVVEFKRVEK